MSHEQAKALVRLYQEKVQYKLGATSALRDIIFDLENYVHPVFTGRLQEAEVLLDGYASTGSWLRFAKAKGVRNMYMLIEKLRTNENHNEPHGLLVTFRGLYTEQRKHLLNYRRELRHYKSI